MGIISRFKASLLTMDKTLSYVVGLLMILSLLGVYSSTGRLALIKYEGNGFYFLLRHAGLLILGVIAMVITKMVNYNTYKKNALYILVLAYGLVLWALMGGSVINGAARWVRIPIVGFTFQPSEFAKIAIVIMTARIIALCQLKTHCHSMAITLFLVTVMPLIAMIFLDNFSTSFLILCACVSMFIVGRMRWSVILKIGAGFIAIVALFILLVIYVPSIPWEKTGRIGTMINRTERFFDNSPKDINGLDSQELRSKIAIANGGLIGVGPGNSEQRNYLPHPYSDFIFAIIVEEYGYVVGGIVMLLYLVILTRIGIIMRRCKRLFPALLVTGYGVIITLQALMHIGVNVGFFPVTGQTLPFVSMGGTSILFTSMMVGIIMSVSYTFSADNIKEEHMQYDDASDEDYDDRSEQASEHHNEGPSISEGNEESLDSDKSNEDWNPHVRSIDV